MRNLKFDGSSFTKSFPKTPRYCPYREKVNVIPDGEHPVYLAVFDEINASEYVAWGALQGVYDNSLLKSEVEDYFLWSDRTSRNRPPASVASGVEAARSVYGARCFERAYLTTK
jgi:hypothetical protein